VSGVIAARTYNGIGIAGISGGWQGQVGVRLIGLRIAQGVVGWTEDYAKEAIDYLTWLKQNYGYTIIANMSFQTLGVEDEPRDMFKASVNAAINAGVIIVSAAGNVQANPNSPYHQAEVEELPIPARFSGVLAIGASKDGTNIVDEVRSDYSLYVSEIDEKWVLATAPVDDHIGSGIEIYTTFPGDNYVNTFHGTSAACPIVTGVVSLLLTVNPSLNYSQLSDILGETAEKIGNYNYNSYGRTPQVGHGRINAYEALRYTLENYGGTLSGNVLLHGDLTIKPGVTLVIEPGTTITFAANQDDQQSGRHTSLCEMTIQGKLEADGATFTSTVQSPGAWYGVVFDNADDNSYIKNCSINYAQSGIYCLNGSDINIEDNTIRYCLYHGINLYNSDPYIHENLIEYGNMYGIYMSGSFPYIYNNKIQNNTSHYGVFYNYASGGLLRHNTIKNNIGGVRCANGSSPILIGITVSEPFGANEIIENGLGGNWWGVCPSDYSHPNLGITNDSTNYLAGRNSIHDNTLWQVANLSSIPVYARRNYWKNYPPYNLGTVVVSSPTSVALPNAGALWKTQSNETQILEYLTKGQELEGQNKLSEAVEAYRWVIDNYPENEYANFAFARLMSCRSQQGKVSLEENYTANIISKYSDQKIGEGAILWLPAIVAKQGRKNEAVSMTTNWMTSKANTELEKSLLFQLAMIYYYEFQDYKAARETMDNFVEQFPDDIRSYDIKNLDFLFDYTPDLPKQDPDASEKPTQIIDNFALEQNYPNPFNPETEINFQIPTGAHVTLVIYNLLGQKIRTLVDKEMSTGYHTIKWHGRDDFGNTVASGVYLYALQAGEFFEVKKMVLMQLGQMSCWLYFTFL